ncbi:TIGR03086 family protein [Nocardioides guangzhouensis]|uniref:TIGR03086 family protein n=1 Tax=Nocardioides guangzhouensis TaxID=2497878 RepID=A0A4Q4Z7X9_9ACTN|nr:TIGR03086 family metal-binding protein [Nocardioides guangzhouensis]RYP83883.1 TIGR03086 family protein [Nocardioides guangzhouensis]
MTASTDPVELLERAIGYTRGTLSGVRDELLTRPTPCSQWSLADLLAHMADSLDALTEASRGVIAIAPAPVVSAAGVGVLRDKACHLLGAWSNPHATEARLGPARIESRVLLHAGALEIAVHGWDVGQATGTGEPIPEALATALLSAAPHLITRADRPSRFGPPTPTTGGAPSSALLLSFTGRHTGCPASQPGLGP